MGTKRKKGEEEKKKTHRKIVRKNHLYIVIVTLFSGAIRWKLNDKNRWRGWRRDSQYAWVWVRFVCIQKVNSKNIVICSSHVRSSNTFSLIAYGIDWDMKWFLMKLSTFTCFEQHSRLNEYDRMSTLTFRFLGSLTYAPKKRGRAKIKWKVPELNRRGMCTLYSVSVSFPDDGIYLMHSGVNIAHFNCTCSFGNSLEMAFAEFSICVPFVDLNRSGDSVVVRFFCRVAHNKRQTSHHIGLSWISSWTHSYLHVLSSFREWRRQMIWDGKNESFGRTKAFLNVHVPLAVTTKYIGYTINSMEFDVWLFCNIAFQHSEPV